MRALAAALARRIWPEWSSLPNLERHKLVAELLAVLYSLPLTLLTTAWLVLATDFSLFRQHWAFILLLTAVGVLAGRIYYFQIVGREAGQFGFNSSDLENVITASGVLILGPPAIWAHLAARVVHFLTHWPEQGSPKLHANWARNLLFNVWAGNLSLLVALYLYRRLGGEIPLADLTPPSLLPALAFVVVEFAVGALLLWILIRQHGLAARRGSDVELAARRRRVMFFFVVAGLPSVFGILGAAIYTQMGLAGYLLFVAAVLLASFLARRQSQAAVLSEQRARQLAQLEELGRAFIQLAPDMEQLPQTLRGYLPRMFDYDDAEIRLGEDTVLLRLPRDGGPRDPRLWEWVGQATQPAAFVKGELLPWSGQAAGENLLLAPIRHTESDEPLGGICLRSRGRITTFGFRESLPSLQVLAAQIASLLHRREAYEKRLALARVTQELALAREMQISLLPPSLPPVEGWELRAVLEPARQTSGDFYDVIELGDGQLGLLVADVADKGMSAALFMALSRTLLRTYAVAYPLEPERVVSAANRRILSDTTDDSFVTLFYGVLQLDSGRLRFVNAGHNPPFLLCSNGVAALQRTGMPLGIQLESQWHTGEAQLAPGDLLLLYSDGITEAHNKDDDLFGVDRLLAVVTECSDEPLARIEAAVLQAVSSFAGDRPQFDDLTLLLARRDGR